MDFEDDGWDVHAVLTDGQWVDRTPRRPEVEAWLRREARLMPWLATQVPLPVSVPFVIAEEPFRVRHAIIVGQPCSGILPAHGESLGGFLGALHRLDPARAVDLGVPDAQAAYTSAQSVRERFAFEVVPLLPADQQAGAAALLGRMTRFPQGARLTHCDLGPGHVRVSGPAVSGIIDWADACIGDPAIDLAWALYGTKPAFARAAIAAYGVDDETAHRARDWYRLGPWHVVLHGIDSNDPREVAFGLEGVQHRLA